MIDFIVLFIHLLHLFMRLYTYIIENSVLINLMNVELKRIIDTSILISNIWKKCSLVHSSNNIKWQIKMCEQYRSIVMILVNRMLYDVVDMYVECNFVCPLANPLQCFFYLTVINKIVFLYYHNKCGCYTTLVWFFAVFGFCSFYYENWCVPEPVDKK